MKFGLVAKIMSVGSKASRFIAHVRSFQDRMRELSDQQLLQASRSLAYEQLCGKRQTIVVVKAFAMVHAAISRVMNVELYDVQHLAGWMLTRQRIAEMQTGEGKTFTAALPAFYFALSGRPVHLATANDYLAERDAQLLTPVFELLGKSVGVIHSGVDPRTKSQAYTADIVYGTASEFGFDFLKEKIRNRFLQTNSRLDENGLPIPEQSIDRHFMLIDEADSLMLDEASTPLIIGATENNRADLLKKAFQWSDEMVPQFKPEDHYRRNEHKQVELTSGGQRLVRHLSSTEDLSTFGLGELYEFIRRAIMVHKDFHCGTHYLVHNDEVSIIDQFTGPSGRRSSMATGHSSGNPS